LNELPDVGAFDLKIGVEQLQGLTMSPLFPLGIESKTWVQA